jgi:hypothetical protein
MSLISLALLCLFKSAFGGMEMIPSEQIEICGKAEESAGVYDVSMFNIVTESDDDFFFNGTVKFLKSFGAPWKVDTFTEQFYRDKWVPGVEKKIPDFCSEMKNPANVFYQFFKDQKDCPIEAGVRTFGRFIVSQ